MTKTRNLSTSFFLSFRASASNFFLLKSRPLLLSPSLYQLNVSSPSGRLCGGFCGFGSELNRSDKGRLRLWPGGLLVRGRPETKRGSQTNSKNSQIETTLVNSSLLFSLSLQASAASAGGCPGGPGHPRPCRSPRSASSPKVRPSSPSLPLSPWNSQMQKN